MPSLYKRGKRLYIGYYVTGARKKPREKSTGVEWEGPAPTVAQVKSSKDPRLKIVKQLLQAIESQRDQIKMARRFPELVAKAEQNQIQSYTFKRLAQLYIQEKADRRSPLEPGTQRTFLNAVELLESFRPGATLKDLNRSFVNDFEGFIYKKESDRKGRKLELSTLNNYIGRLRVLVNWAVSKDWIQSNPLKSISIKVTKSDPVHDDFADEIEYIRWVWHKDPEFFAHYMYERLTGFRVSDGLLLKRSDVDWDKELVHGFNKKFKRKEPWPLHNSLRALLRLIWELPTKHQNALEARWREEHVLPLNATHKVTYRQERLWKERPMAKTGTHNWKRNYSKDIDSAEPPEQVSKYLKHHTPDDLARRYSGRPLELMRKYSDLALDKFVPVLSELATEMQRKSN